MKKLVTDYEFQPQNFELRSPAFQGLSVQNVLLIVNLTRGVVLYNPTNPLHVGASLDDANVFGFSLTTDFSGSAGTDQLQIWIEDGTEIAKNDNLDTLVYFASAIHEKLPVCDTNDRVLANVTGSVSVSTLANLTTLNSLQNQPVAFAPYNWASGAYHIYNGIDVTNPYVAPPSPFLPTVSSGGGGGGGVQQSGPPT